MENTYLELVPDDLSAIHQLAQLHVKLNQYNVAINVLEKGLAISALDISLLSLKAEVEMKQKNYQQASNTLAIIAKHKPTNINIKQRLALAKFADGEIPSAIKILETLIGKKTSEITSNLILAEVFLNQKRYDKAIKIGSDLLTIAPENPMLYNILGNAHLGKNQPRQAEINFQKAINAQADFIPAMLNLAEMNITSKNHEQAISRLNHILTIDERNAQAMNKLSLIAQLEGDPKLEIEWLTKAYKVNSNADIGIKLIKRHIEHSPRFKAKQLLGELLQNHPENLNIHAIAATISVNSDNLEKAKNIYARMASMAADIKSTKWLLTIARYQHAIDDLKGMNETLRIALKLSPNNIAILAEKIEIKLASGEFQSALDSSKEIIKISPQSPTGYRLAGDVAGRMNQPENAIKWYEKGLTLTDGNQKLALTYYKHVKQKNPLEAVIFLEQWVLAKRPKDLRPMQALTAGYAEIGNYTKAIEINKLLLKKQPNNPYFLNNLASSYSETGNPEAIIYAEQAYALLPEAPAILDTLGWILTQKGEYKKALPHLRNAAIRSFDIPDIHYHYAVALSLSDYKKEAIKELQQALQARRSFKDEEKAKALLKKLQQ